jgi:hypothetical protein
MHWKHSIKISTTNSDLAMAWSQYSTRARAKGVLNAVSDKGRLDLNELPREVS